MVEGAVASMLPTVTMHRFGDKEGHRVFGIMYSAMPFATFSGSIIVFFF